MDKTEQIKKLKELIKRIERASGELQGLEIDVMGVLDEIDFRKVSHSNLDVIQRLNNVKYILEERLKYLQESNENTLSN